jgi:hypothetical protein
MGAFLFFLARTVRLISSVDVSRVGQGFNPRRPRRRHGAAVDPEVVVVTGFAQGPSMTRHEA